MNKAAIKNFAVEARKKLIASVKDKAGRIGITKENITEALSKGEGYAVFSTHIGIETTLMGKELKQRENLVNRIQGKTYEFVMEEAAYTWFNRIIAVRFMEVNDYLPSRIRVLSSESKGKFEPDIVTQAPKIDLKLAQSEIEEIISLKEKSEQDRLFRKLFIKQCNELGEVLPELFEDTSKYDKDYTEILLDISYTHEDGVIRDLLKINEEDFLEAVEIIGWMYQYYNTESKDETFALLKQNVKITKERIPAATQLFTPDWIVRYMVENSLGRLWLEGHPNNILRAGWKYYLDEAAQEPEVITQLEKIRSEYNNLNPEEIKLIDPCMGSGHILVYAFEVLMQIYESCGYTQRDAARLIVEKNVYGLDIDDRAYQLAYFAVMMKGRKYDRRFLTKGITPNLCSVQESNSLTSIERGAGQLNFNNIHKTTANYLIQAFKDAKEYGSIINIEERDYDGLFLYIEELQSKGPNNLLMSMWLNNISNIMPALIKQAKIMTQKYDTVVTNPPYMGGSGMGAKLSEYVKKNYPASKSDLFAIFIEKGLEMAKRDAYNCMVTMQSWMFLSSYEDMRTKIITNKTINNLMHMENMVMGIAFGTAVTVFKNSKLPRYKGTYNYIRLNDIANDKPKEFPIKENRFSHVNSDHFLKIPGIPIAYWVSNNLINNYKTGKLMGEIAKPRQGMATCDNNRFLRRWYEVNNSKLGFNCSSIEECKNKSEKWFPYNKGGSFRKWFGNNEYVINWENDGLEVKQYAVQLYKSVTRTIKNIQFYFKEGITYTFISSSKFGVRYSPKGFIFDVAGSTVFVNSDIQKYILAFMISKITKIYLDALNPTLNFQVGDIKNVPIIIRKENKPQIAQIDRLAEQNIRISKTDWDSFETSWDFENHPLIKWQDDSGKLKKSLDNWQNFTEKQFIQLKANEEELNRIFIEIYGLQDELTPEVEDEDVTFRKADLSRDICSFISYAVGCMFGRYSLNEDGLVYAGGEWKNSKYATYAPDKDNIISITDEEYFDDDIIARFVNFVKVVYGEGTLEENLDFIANALDNKGSTSREAIRNYFLMDFYKDHVKTYQKRPIYWLFDGGKENGFKALIYLHRYDEDTVGRVRADYLHKTQAAIENAIAHCDVVLGSNAPASDKANAVKQKEKLVKQLAETRIYDQAIAHIAHRQISLDLDDGVKLNYAKFQGIEVASEGKKSFKVDLLGKI